VKHHALVGLLGLLWIGGGQEEARALVPNNYVSYFLPAASVSAPFDASEGRVTALQVTNLSGASSLSGPSGDGRPFVPSVQSHWVFWTETGEPLADIFICLPLGGSVVVNPRSLRSTGKSDLPSRPAIDLSGRRGLVTITAYETDALCSFDQIPSGGRLVDRAIVASFSIIDSSTEETFQSNGLGFGLDCLQNAFFQGIPPCEGERFVELPPFGIDSTELIEVESDDPTTIADSSIIFVALEQGTGLFAGEPGPVAEVVTGDSEFLFGPEISEAAARTGTRNTGKADPERAHGSVDGSSVSFRAALFRKLFGGEEGLFPRATLPPQRGMIRIGKLRAGNADSLGPKRWIWGIHGQRTNRPGSSTQGIDRVAAEPVSVRATLNRSILGVLEPFSNEDAARSARLPTLQSAGFTTSPAAEVRPPGAAPAEGRSAFDDVSIGLIEVPARGREISGIRSFSGWVCEAPLGLEISVDGGPAMEVGYGTARGDTMTPCGDSNNGFSVLFNFNLLGDGEHEAVLRDRLTGGVVDRTTFRVVTLGASFIRGESGSCEMTLNGRRATFVWSEAAQNFVLAGVDP
jgi:hypothetical protein